MNKIKAFFVDTYTELVQKVSWPTWEELQSSMIVVTVATVILALMVWVMNEVSNLGMSSFYHLFQ
ncbi:MAG: preprotein translocase subunit SecE [Chitinophagales bacterium]|nr:preprotein translocase subunit SecE [Bacteroidota bacterium]MBX7141425.1 preprotein translocase subunit SecE [Chitinophagales bacterium]